MRVALATLAEPHEHAWGDDGECIVVVGLGAQRCQERKP